MKVFLSQQEIRMAFLSRAPSLTHLIRTGVARWQWCGGLQSPEYPRRQTRNTILRRVMGIASEDVCICLPGKSGKSWENREYSGKSQGMGEWKRENLDISQPVSRRPTHVPAFKCQIRRRPWAACTWLLAINQAVDAIYGPANSMSYCLPACCLIMTHYHYDCCYYELYSSSRRIN